MDIPKDGTKKSYKVIDNLDMEAEDGYSIEMDFSVSCIFLWHFGQFGYFVCDILF
jgi:hypothetical protein